MSTSKSPELDHTLDRLRSEFCALVQGLTPEQTQWRPLRRPNAWCIQQIVEHLLLTYKGTSDIVKERLARGTPTRKPATFKQKCMRFIVISAGYFPSGQVAPSIVEPASDTIRQGGQELALSISESISALGDVIAESERTLGRGRSVTHGVMGPMSMQQWRKFQLVHGRHHIRQIMAICAEHGL